MNIPSKVKIGVKVYDVVTTEVFEQGADQLGGIDYFDQLIKIRPTSQHTMEQTLLHEIIHGILFDMGITKQKEKFIEALTNELHRLIYDNPLLFAPPVGINDNEKAQE